MTKPMLQKFVPLFFFLLPFLNNILPVYAQVSVNELDWIWPVDGVISDTYGSRNGRHRGVDVASDLDTPVYAVANGMVTKSYYSQSYGHVIFIKHDEGYETVYAHLQKRLVEKGERVKKGDTIGTMGSTGHSSGPHLHFEVHKNFWTVHKENAIDPFLIFGSARVGDHVFAHQKSLDEASPVWKSDRIAPSGKK